MISQARIAIYLACVLWSSGKYSDMETGDKPSHDMVPGAIAGYQKVVTVDPLEHAKRWIWDVPLAGGVFVLQVDDRVLSFCGDSSDPGQVIIDVSGKKEPVKYRFWPDIRTWRVSEEWAARYAAEFEGIKGWRERSICVALDADATLRRVWIDGRLVTSWRPPQNQTLRITVAGPLETMELSSIDQSVGVGRFLELDLASYFHEGVELSSAFDKCIRLDSVAGLRYISSVAVHPNMDLGKLAYRDAHLDKGPFQGISFPYLMCDAMSSDPARAIFRVPARFYDRLHLLCYADTDEDEVPRAAVRFMKVDRARFLTQEFGIVPEDRVHIRETFLIGTVRCVHVIVDLNPAAFQEFLIESDNEYLEFELTQPVVMDSNTLEHPAGPASSLHVIAMALEEAPVAMRVVSDVPGHLFEHPEEAVMRICLKSRSEIVQSVLVDACITMPDGRVRKEQFASKIEPLQEKTFALELGDAPVGKSDLVVRLEVIDAAGDKRSMERATSFAILPHFERTASDSPFGMWSFFENHHGADIETTCQILRKAGVRGTLTNFILGVEPETWEENARRTVTLRSYGIEPNWSCLAGIANTALDSLGDLDAKFAWVKAHPQVVYYNLFWETTISRRAPRMCPPEISGGKPIEWNEEEQDRIAKYLSFGKTWAARARREAPDIKLCFGNGFPDFLSAMLRAGFPHEYIDGLGLDFDMYTSAPEDQPSMWYAPFSGIYYVRELRKVYHCEDKPIWLSEAIYCPTSPIWISERQQADYYVRAHLLALAMGVERFGMCAEPIDPDGWYHYGHYGPVGLCHAPPELNPRDAFCAYATMTGVLDGAVFDAMVDLSSPHAYALRFRRGDGTGVHAFWTVHGTRNLDLRLNKATDFRIFNRDGRDITSEIASRQHSSGRKCITLRLHESPIYLVGPEQFEVCRLSAAEPLPMPANIETLMRFDSLDGWTQVEGRVPGYEEINLSTPLAWVNLDLYIKNDRLNVRPPQNSGTHPLETLCMAIRRIGPPLEVSKEYEAIGVCARGDRSWGRVVFVLEDAKGSQWISARSQTPVDVDGSVYLETALPKGPSQEHAGFRGYRFWRQEPGDMLPEYPMRLTGLLFEIRTHAIHGPNLMPLSTEGFSIESIVLRK